MKEKTYQVDLFRNYGHGCYGSRYQGIGSFVVTATSKAKAKELVLDNMIGLVASEWNFPIDAKHAPEFHEVELNGVMCMEAKQEDVEKHIINEYDIQLKNKFVADISIIEQ